MYWYKDIVKYSDVDKNGKLPLYGILEYFQNCINFHSLDIGKDYRAMNQYGKVWVLISWKIKLYKEIYLYDNVEIGTWSHGFDRMYGYRNYEMKNDAGERLACADTRWILIDLDSRMPARISPEDLQGYATGEKIDIGNCPRKIKLSDVKEEKESVKVLKTYIDTNRHMNNTAYFRLAQEYIPDGFRYNTVEAVYVKETTEGMEMIPFVHEEANGIGISFEGKDGTIFTNMRFYTE